MNAIPMAFNLPTTETMFPYKSYEPTQKSLSLTKISYRTFMIQIQRNLEADASAWPETSSTLHNTEVEVIEDGS